MRAVWKIPRNKYHIRKDYGGKLYSYNALLSRFNLEKVPISFPLNTRLDTHTDFVLTIGEDMEESAFLGETGVAPEEINSEVLPPQEPPRKRKNTKTTL